MHFYSKEYQASNRASSLRLLRAQKVIYNEISLWTVILSILSLLTCKSTPSLIVQYLLFKTFFAKQSVSCDTVRLVKLFCLILNLFLKTFTCSSLLGIFPNTAFSTICACCTVRSSFSLGGL